MLLEKGLNASKTKTEKHYICRDRKKIVEKISCIPNRIKDGIIDRKDLAQDSFKTLKFIFYSELVKESTRMKSLEHNGAKFSRKD